MINKSYDECNSFWKLINEYKIKIPIIQRDYAQGRNTEKVKEIRNTFLNDIYRTLVNNKTLDLDFIYGNIEDGNILTPLDGQQRLTTLFLLHWYLSIKDKKIKETNEVLSKFTYETRVSSREFCNALIKNYSLFENIDLNSLDLISEEIKNSRWFFIYWENDPTIKAMLAMLDTIHIKFKDTNNLLERLINKDNPSITFKFMPLKDFGLEDSLYIKMNARGKMLTDFENFKAKFEQILINKENNKELENGYTKTFINNIDTKWTDLFWNYRDKENNLFDNKIMNLFDAILTNNYATSRAGNRIEVEENINYLIDNKGNTSFLKYKEFGCFEADAIEEISIVLDKLSNSEKHIRTYLKDDRFIDEKKLFETMINDSSEHKITYTDRVKFYALTQFFAKHKTDIDKECLYEWMRVIRNLAENSLYNNVKDYIRSLVCIKEIVNYSDDILSYITSEAEDINGFFKEQVKEEKIKSKLILKGNEWRNIIYKAEEHKYFKGQIGFILEFSGITSSYEENINLEWSLAEAEKYKNSFKTYLEKSENIFDNSGLCVNENTWRRALLCKGNYLLQKGKNYSFLIDNHRDISWKRLLRDMTEKRNYVKYLMDDINLENIENSLLNIIKENAKGINDWRRYFIRYPEILEECGHDKYIRQIDENDILLLSTSRTSGYCSEYYTYSLYLELKKEGYQLEYVPSVGVDADKYIRVDNNEISIYIKYISLESRWTYVVEVDEIKEPFDKKSEVIEYLKENGYLYKEDNQLEYAY